MLNELKTAPRVVGVNQLKKALKKDAVRCVFLAKNADPMLTDPVAELCAAQRIPVVWVPTMAELGAACQISVGASAAGLLR